MRVGEDGDPDIAVRSRHLPFETIDNWIIATGIEDHHLDTVRAIQTGEHIIHLPQKTEVWDLSQNRRVARATDRIVVTAQAPATFLFHLGPLK